MCGRWAWDVGSNPATLLGNGADGLESCPCCVTTTEAPTTTTDTPTTTTDTPTTTESMETTTEPTASE